MAENLGLRLLGAIEKPLGLDFLIASITVSEFYKPPNLIAEEKLGLLIMNFFDLFCSFGSLPSLKNPKLYPTG